MAPWDIINEQWHLRGERISDFSTGVGHLLIYGVFVKTVIRPLPGEIGMPPHTGRLDRARSRRFTLSISMFRRGDSLFSIPSGAAVSVPVVPLIWQLLSVFSFLIPSIPFYPFYPCESNLVYEGP